MLCIIMCSLHVLEIWQALKVLWRTHENKMTRKQAHRRLMLCDCICRCFVKPYCLSARRGDLSKEEGGRYQPLRDIVGLKRFCAEVLACFAGDQICLILMKACRGRSFFLVHT